MEKDERIQIFDDHRGRLFGIAYRMLGTAADAEDILQDAYIRWHGADPRDVKNPEAWLVTVVTRLSIDRLRKASRDRETYIGPWLPEPLITSGARTPEDDAVFASDLSLAFLTMLERLSPTERAVFLLHDVFDCEYSEIARITDKTEAAVRQMIHRARERVRSDKTRFQPSDAERVSMVRKFAAAAFAGDEKTLLSLFADEVALTSDGGGKVNAALRTVYGARRLTNLFTVVTRKAQGRVTAQLITINGETGVLEFLDGKPFAVTAFSIDKGKISAIYRVMNPDKLKAFADVPHGSAGDLLSQTSGLDRPS